VRERVLENNAPLWKVGKLSFLSSAILHIFNKPSAIFFFDAKDFHTSMEKFKSLLSNVQLLAATKAAEIGVDGIVVSNHGGRQLDYAPATISVLEEVIAFTICS